MSITLKGTAGAWTAGTNSSQCTVPSHAIGDKIVVYVMAKPGAIASPPTISTPSGWTLVATGNNGSGIEMGIDAGQTWHWSFEKTATTASETWPATTITNGNVNGTKADVFARTNSAYTWDTITGVNVADTSSGTGFSLAGTLTVGINDMIGLGACLSGNDQTFNATWTYSATGMTFGTVTKSGTDLSTSNGNDLRTSAAYGLITAGTSASVTVTAANTLGGAQVGGGIIVRLRETAPATLVADAQASPSSVSDDTTNISLDASGSTGSPTSYRWEQICGPTGVIIDATDPTTTYDATIASGGTTPTHIAASSDHGFEATSNVGTVASSSGDLLLAFLVSSSGTPTPPDDGWVCIGDSGTGSTTVRVWCYAKLATGSLGATAWTWSTSHWHGVIVSAWRGCNVPGRAYTAYIASTTTCTVIEMEAKTNALLVKLGYADANAGTTRSFSGSNTGVVDTHSTGTAAMYLAYEAKAPGLVGNQTFTVSPGNSTMRVLNVLLEAV